MFLKQLTDSMRASLKPFKSDLINNDSMELFEGMFYDEVSYKIAQSQGLGLVDWLNDISEKQEPKSGLIPVSAKALK
jgi:Rod binding domain-containing protein